MKGDELPLQRLRLERLAMSHGADGILEVEIDGGWMGIDCSMVPCAHAWRFRAVSLCIVECMLQGHGIT